MGKRITRAREGESSLSTGGHLTNAAVHSQTFHQPVDVEMAQSILLTHSHLKLRHRASNSLTSCVDRSHKAMKDWPPSDSAPCLPGLQVPSGGQPGPSKNPRTSQLWEARGNFIYKLPRCCHLQPLTVLTGGFSKIDQILS